MKAKSGGPDDGKRRQAFCGWSGRLVNNVIQEIYMRTPAFLAVTLLATQIAFAAATVDGGTEGLIGDNGHSPAWRPLALSVDPVPNAVALNGLFYDPSTPGQGFDVNIHEQGMSVYFYGHTKSGERLWLISDLYQGEIEYNAEIILQLFEVRAGVFGSPQPPESVWGNLVIRFQSCDDGSGRLEGMDGTIEFEFIRLVGLKGVSCDTTQDGQKMTVQALEGQQSQEPGLNGLFYDAANPGHGLNFNVHALGTTIFYYGHTAGGARLWLISELHTGEFRPGVPVAVDLFEVVKGTFGNPIGPETYWGRLELELNGCDVGSAKLYGADGNLTMNLTRLVALPGYTCDAGKIVFASLSDRQIYTVNIDGSGRTRLTNSAVNSRPVWSPDGQRIAFVRQDSQSDFPDIYLMSADGSNVLRRTVGAGYGSVAWSPDGQKLAVSTEGLYESSMWVIKVTDDGSAPLHIAADGRTPAWSPDGQKIAFIRVSGDDGYDALATVNADGTGTTQITANSGGRYGLSWSPDGRRLASEACVAGRCNLLSMNTDGSNVTQLTTVGTASWGASYSADGQWIAVGLWSSAPSLAYVSAQGGATMAITSDGMSPSWQP